ncbi:hypothetical protein ACNUDN_30430 [Mycobacterium sp. smrl_JER01]|uniref:hypothetical protein n=1 Tax=Mycobacterium sp. smrl_JER01 TaxID=3402633 RepID=UPI003ABF9D09
MRTQNPHGALTWRTMGTDPSCDELRIEVSWGAWPYRIVAYANDALVERYVPDAPRRHHFIERGDRAFESMLSEARAIAERWDAEVQVGAARQGFPVSR